LALGLVAAVGVRLAILASVISASLQHWQSFTQFAGPRSRRLASDSPFVSNCAHCCGEASDG
jgi:hypothetical protein